MPPGRSDRSEWFQVAAPTVSMTASTRSGSRAPVSKTWWAPISSARARLASSRLVASTCRPPARARVIRAVATPPPAPWTSTVWPGLRPPWTKSIRYAVSQAVGRQAASSKDSDAGLGTRLPAGPRPGRRACPGSARRAGTAGGPRSRRRARPGHRSRHGRAPRCRPRRARRRRSRGSSAAPPRAGPTPRSDQRSWWFSDDAFTLTVVQPSGTSGSGRSPTTRPASGSSAEKDSAYTANMPRP